MPRHGMKEPEKVKDFKGTLIRIFKSLEKWKYVLVLSCVLAMFASILSTVAPNKLADVTDVISESIKPNVEAMKDISESISKNVASCYHTSNPSSLFIEFNKLSKEEKINILNDIEVNNVKISAKDQVNYLEIVSSLSKDSDNNELIKKLDQMPKSIKKIIEPKLDSKELKKRSVILGIIYLLNSIFGYVVGILMAYVGIGYSKRLRTDISSKINKLPLKYFDTHETGDLLSRVTNDVDSIGINMSNNITSFVTNFTLFFGSVVMMFVTNWVMALTAIFASVFGFFGSGLILKKSQKYFIERQSELGKLNGHIEEIYSGHNVVKAYNGEEEALNEFNKINNNLYDCNRKSQFLSGIMQPLMNFIGNFGYVAVCVVGALLVMNGKTSFGVIVAFMIYVRLFTNPLSRLAQAATTMQSIAAAAERVYEFMDEEELSDEKNITTSLSKKVAKGNIQFKNVKFGYNPEKTIIKDFSCNIKSGQKIAIVGPTGAGKTTIVNLLMKFYEINSGDIIIDGRSIHDLSRKNIHDLFVMVLQDTWLFDGTIRDNIKFNKKNVSDEKIFDTCKTVGIDHFIKTLPGGLKSEVNDSDAISSGQKQLLTIARGMIEDAPFLILDEATSNVDTRTEELVQKAMDKLCEGKTSFIIAHRLSTIKNADLILVMNEGNIIEQGTHEELLKKKGFYADLYNSQFEL
ncbi:MAG: ABC transporter ATP-binding protein [Bacilli bacterium]|nr:ABC transporter ATP-binding protein [Bacilli bacterium]